MMASAASKILRVFAVQIEALRRFRNGSSQYVRVGSGAQANIGTSIETKLRDAAREMHNLANPALFGLGDWPLGSDEVRQVSDLLTATGVIEEFYGCVRYLHPATERRSSGYSRVLRPSTRGRNPSFSCSMTISPTKMPWTCGRLQRKPKPRRLKTLLYGAYFRRFVRSVSRH
jgi:hypothetical protein